MNNEHFIHFLSGYLEDKLSKKDLKALLHMIEHSEEEKSLLAKSAVVHRLLKVARTPQVSEDVIMQALPRNDDTADEIIRQITSRFESAQRKTKKEAKTPRLHVAGKRGRKTIAPVHRIPAQRKPGILLVLRPILAVAACFLIIMGVRHLTQERPQTDPFQATASIEPRGNVVILREGQMITPKPGSPVFAGDKVTTLENDQAVIRFHGEHTYVRLRAGSELTLREQNSAKHLFLEKGSLSAGVSKQPEGSPMIISTQLAEMKVLGTHFRLRCTPRLFFLEVSEGEILATRKSDNSSTEVTAGRYIIIDNSSAALSSLELKDPIIGHVGPDQLDNIDEMLDTARAFTINTLICDSDLISSTPASQLRKAITAAHKANIKFFAKLDISSSNIKALCARTEEIIKEYDCDGFYFTVERKDAQTSELLRALSNHIALTQPGTQLMAGTKRSDPGSGDAWHLGY